MARVKPTIADVSNRNAWQFFAGNDATGKPTWADGDVFKAKPVRDVTLQRRERCYE
jgi:hypothetical protein